MKYYLLYRDNYIYNIGKSMLDNKYYTHNSDSYKSSCVIFNKNIFSIKRLFQQNPKHEDNYKIIIKED